MNSKLKEEIRKFEEERDLIIHEGVKLNSLTKKVIYSLIRDDFDSAKKYMEELDKKYKELKEKVKNNPRLFNNFAINEQEYVEAKIFFEYINSGKILEYEEMEVDPINYFNGLADFCGELLRKSVEEMIKGNIDFALNSKKVIEEIYLKMLDLEPKLYDLRKKIDYVAGILNKLSEYIFQRTNIKQ